MNTLKAVETARQTCVTALLAGVSSLLLIIVLLGSSCSRTPTQMRSLAPAESLVYIESDDVASAIRPIIESRTFTDAAKSKPDISQLKGVQMAVAVLGFEAKEERMTEEHSIGSVRPRFVAIVDTHSWNWQAAAFAKNQLNSFVNDVYRGDAKLEQQEKFGGTYLTWAASDGRTVYALVVEGLIYFANDETAIQKCVAVRRGEAESIAKAGKGIAAQPGTLAQGFVTEEGVSQIANLASLQMASESSEESEVQSAIAGLLPQLVRGNFTNVGWSAGSTGSGYTDTYSIGLSADVAPIFVETLAPSTNVDPVLSAFVPAAAPSVTLYNLKDPAVAWRSLLLTFQAKADALGARVITELARGFGEPYGVADPEMFLAGTGKNVISLRLDPEGDRPILIASVANRKVVEESLYRELKPDLQLSSQTGVEVLSSAESETASAFVNGYLITGDRSAVLTILDARGKPDAILDNSSGAFAPGNASTTLYLDSETSAHIADLLSERKDEKKTPASYSVARTRFTRNGIERVVTSDLGLIGWIVAQLATE